MEKNSKSALMKICGIVLVIFVLTIIVGALSAPSDTSNDEVKTSSEDNDHYNWDLEYGEGIKIGEPFKYSENSTMTIHSAQVDTFKNAENLFVYLTLDVLDDKETVYADTVGFVDEGGDLIYRKDIPEGPIGTSLFGITYYKGSYDSFVFITLPVNAHKSMDKFVFSTNGLSVAQEGPDNRTYLDLNSIPVDIYDGVTGEYLYTVKDGKVVDKELPSVSEEVPSVPEAVNNDAPFAPDKTGIGNAQTVIDPQANQEDEYETYENGHPRVLDEYGYRLYDYEWQKFDNYANIEFTNASIQSIDESTNVLFLEFDIEVIDDPNGWPFNLPITSVGLYDDEGTLYFYKAGSIPEDTDSVYNKNLSPGMHTGEYMYITYDSGINPSKFVINTYCNEIEYAIPGDTLYVDIDNLFIK